MSIAQQNRIEALQKMADELMIRCTELERRFAQYEAAKQPVSLGNTGNPMPTKKRGRGRG